MQTKLLTKPIPYTFIRDGYYYFTRRVPTDLQGYYRYPWIVQGLQTPSSREARVLANLEAAKLEAYWSKMRLTKTEVLGEALLSKDQVGTPPKEAERANINSLSNSPRLSEALEMYVSLKGKEDLRRLERLLRELVSMLMILSVISQYRHIIAMMG